MSSTPERHEDDGDIAICPHGPCRKRFDNEMLRDDKRIPTHDFPEPCRAVCPGSGRWPANYGGAECHAVEALPTFDDPTWDKAIESRKQQVFGEPASDLVAQPEDNYTELQTLPEADSGDEAKNSPVNLPSMKDSSLIADPEHLIAFENHGAWSFDDRILRWHCIAGCGGNPAAGHSAKCPISLLCRLLRVFIDTQTTATVATCAWSMDTNDENEIWETECGQSWQLTTGGPSENAMLYCCYCGKAMRVRYLNVQPVEKREAKQEGE